MRPVPAALALTLQPLASLAGRVAILLLALASFVVPAHAGPFTIIQPGAISSPPTVPPPFAHWDLRRFTDCEIPYAIGRTPAGLAAGVATANVDNAFTQWQNVEPAIIRFRNVGAAPASTSANDGNNTVFWDNDLCNGDPWDASLIGGAIGLTFVRQNAATGILPDVDMVLDDAHFTWTNGTQQFPGGDDQFATEIAGDGSRRRVINCGANGICESRALCGDVQVVAVGANGGAFATGVRSGNAGTMAPAPPAPLIASIANFTGRMDVWTICAHEAGHFCGLGENNGPNTGSEVNESFNNGPFNIPAGATLSFTINGNAVNAALTPGAARTAAQVAADINAAIAVQQAGAGNAIANPIGSVEIRAAAAGQPVIVTGNAAAVAALNFLTGESGMSTMNQPDLRGLNSLDQRTLSRHDWDGLNFLYTPDLGDATDPAAGPRGRYQTLVHGDPDGTTLNGVNLLAAGVGAEHLFGFPPNRWEWLGAKEDGSNLECEARVPDLDDFDDGLSIAGGRLLVGDSARVTVLVNATDPGGRYLAGIQGRSLHFNGYFDFNGNKLFEPAERAIFWSGVPGSTDAASPNFYPSLSDLTVNPMVLTFKVLASSQSVLLTDSLWVRARLDYGENEGRFLNRNGDLAPAQGVAQFGEVEDKRFATFTRLATLQCPPAKAADPLHPANLEFCIQNQQSSPTHVIYQISDKLGWITGSDLPLANDFVQNPVETDCITVTVKPPGTATLGAIDTVCIVLNAPDGNQRDTCCATVTYQVVVAAEIARFFAVPDVGGVALNWELGVAPDVTAFNLYRSDAAGEEVRVNASPIPVNGARAYTFTDNSVAPGADYDYALGLLGTDGRERRAATLTVQMPRVAFALGSPMPNPTDGGFAVRLATPRSGFAKVRLYDVGGRAVATLFDGLLAAGERTIAWDGRGANGRRVESGLYFVVYEAVGRQATQRVVIVR